MSVPSVESISGNIKVPSLPIGVSESDYRRTCANAIRMRLVRGEDYNDAFLAVTGSRPVKPRKAKKERIGWKKPLLATVATGMVAAGLAGFYAQQEVAPEHVKALNSDAASTQVNMGDQMILVTGSDERPSVDKGSGTSDDVPGVRTDVMSLVSIPADGSRAIAVSIPRDLMVNRPECQIYNYTTGDYLDSTEPAEENVKINSVFELGGDRCLVNTLESNLGVSITKYAQVNFDTFGEIVDAVGGVTVHADQPMVDEILGTIIPQAGDVKLDGEDALKYVRARHVEGTSMSDFDRIQRQQKLMSALISKMTSSGELKSPNFIRKLVTNVLPDMRVDGISTTSAIDLAKVIAGMDKGAIRMTTLPISEESMSQNDLYMDQQAAKDLFIKLRENLPLAGDAPRGVDRKSAYRGVMKSLSGNSVNIVAKSQYDERAKSLKARLQQTGANVSIVVADDLPEKSSIVVSSGNKDLSATLVGMYPNANVTGKTSDFGINTSGNAVVTIGDDFDQAYRFSNSVEYGKAVLMPKDGDFRADSLVPEKLPDNPGGRSSVTVK